MTTVQFDNAAYNRQPESEPALRSVKRLPLLYEQVEDRREHRRVYADATVAH